MNILGTGLSGLVGSRIVELLSSEHTFENLSLETGVDITDKKTVETYISRSSAHWVFHLAAYTNVQGAQKEQELKKESIAWKVNVIATEHIVETCKKYGKKLIYLDTDYAFDGVKKTYNEEDAPNPLGWYAKTKSEGARLVLSYPEGLVLRISNPYRAFPVGKKDFVHKMLERMQSGETVTAPTDQSFAPTFIDDIAVSIRTLMSVNANGLYHVVGSKPLSPYEAAQIIATQYKINPALIKETTFAEMFRDRAPVPQYASLSTAKIQKLGVETRSFYEGVIEMKRQEAHPQVA